MKKKTNNIVPIWYFKPLKTLKQSNICVTGNSPESTEYIISYLRKRDDVSNNSYLFQSEREEKNAQNNISTYF